MDTLQEWQQELSKNKTLQHHLSNFISQFGISNIEHALQLYTNLHREYICKTKSSVSKFHVYDIYYLQIQGHHISIHTQSGIYQKYGALTKELKLLSPYGFEKCSQSCIVSLSKIRSIHLDTILLMNGEKLHMSRGYATKIIMAYSQYNPFRPHQT
ncbi:MAG: LytTR family transcriptional regulator [Dorea sp.]|jgi:DNA-binding LytR/AlgR family response regulator|nr:LytTR family transcriptional regulator [Dorea sp.]